MNGAEPSSNPPDRAAQDASSRRTPNDAPTVGVGLRICCPHCGQEMETDGEGTWRDLTCSKCGSHFDLIPSETATRAAPPVKKIGHFDFIEQIGYGAFGTVWKARDTTLDRTVAIKVPRRGQLDPAETEQFLREARAAAQLRHPNIVAIHEVGRADDLVFIVSDIVRGMTLSDWLADCKRMPPRQVAEICATMAEALEHAHDRGVVHRDIKPGNIMLDTDYVPFVMDFGLAKRKSGDATLTMDGRLLGTPAYMSPEQASGRAHDADHRTDVYSLGATMYQMLTGQVPFSGNHRVLVVKILSEEPPRPRKLHGDIPRDLETIALKCLEKDPARRYATAQALADDLRRYLAGEPILARPIRLPTRVLRWCRRKPVVAALSLSTAVLLGVLVGVLAWVALRPPPPVAELPEPAAPAAAKWIRRPVLEDSPIAADVMAVTWSPDGQQLAAATKQLLVIYDATTGDELHRLSASSDQFNAVAWGPRNGVFATGGADRIVRTWDVSSERVLHSMSGHKREVRALALSPDERRVASGSADRTCRIWDVGTGRQLALLEGHEAAVSAVAFSPDGRRLASGGADFRIVFWDAVTHKQRAAYGTHGATVSAIAWDPQSVQLASGGEDGALAIWDAETAEKRLVLRDHPSAARAVAWHPRDANLVAVGYEDGLTTIWDLRTARPSVFLRKHDTSNSRFPVRAVAWRHDGARLATGANDWRVRVWDPARDNAPSESAASDLVEAQLAPRWNALVKAGAEWKYLDRGSDQGSKWRAPQFDDSSWKSGPAELGYGDGDEATTLDFGVDSKQKHITTYFRHAFEVKDPSALKDVVLRLRCDDGAMVYLNGRRVVRWNLQGEVRYQTLARQSSDDGDEWIYSVLQPSILVSGRNVLAAEVHQDKRDGSDISFDLSLGTDAIDELVRLLDHRDPFVKRQAIERLRSVPYGAESAIRPLVKLMRASEANVQREILRTLAAIAVAKSLPDYALSAVIPLIGSKDQRLAEEAVRACRDAPAGQADRFVPQLVARLDGASVSLRRALILAIAHFDEKALPAVPALQKLLEDDSPEVAAWAGAVLVWIDPRTGALLVSGHNASDEETRHRQNAGTWLAEKLLPRIVRPGQTAEAYGRWLAAAENAFAMAPHVDQAWRCRAMAIYRTGRWDAARRLYEEHIESNPDQITVHDAAFLAMALSRTGEFGKAKHWVDEMRRAKALGRWSETSEESALLREAEGLLASRPSDQGPRPPEPAE